MRTLPTPTDRPTRRTLFDRVRGVLIIGVVAGHTIYSIDAEPVLINALEDPARIVRMPAFFLVAGALLKHRTFSNQLIVVLRHLVPIYAAGVALQTLINLLLDGEFGVQILPPVYGLWFLIALGLLRLVPSLTPHKGSAVVIAVIAASAASMIDLPQSVWTARTLMLAPFFAIGVWLGADRLERLALQLGWLRAALLLGACGIGVNIITVTTGLPATVLEWRTPLTELGVSPLSAIGVNITILAGALGASVGAIGLIAQIRHVGWLESIGRQSVVIFIGHFPVFRVVQSAWSPYVDSEAALLLSIIGLTVAGVLVPLAVAKIVRTARSMSWSHSRA